MINEETKQEVVNRLKRIEGQVQGLQRMVGEEKYCVDILHQVSAVQGALEQVSKRLLGRHIESCVGDAFTSGSGRERERKIQELLEVFSRFGR
ncbi:MAG: metal-sensitive transcriptional regulator [Candidatus Methylomirabilales bacterium]